jgi:hypothetical protein
MAGAGGHSHPRAFAPGAPVIQQTQSFPLTWVKNFFWFFPHPTGGGSFRSRYSRR